METRVQRWTAWAGGPLALLVVVLVEVALASTMALDPMISIAVVLAAAGIVVVMERPLLGVGLLLATRILSTGATVFFRVGKIGVGPYEPALLLCLGSLVVYAALHDMKLLRTWPWAAPLLALMAWMAVSLSWSRDPGDGLGELLPLVLVVANCLVILCFVRTWDDFRLMLWCWLGACVLVGALAIGTDAMGISTGQSFEAASRGGRETGLGQQPNWFAMNLMFVIHTAFGMALVERNRLVRVALVLAGFFVFFMMLKSGSRGGAYATLIGGSIAAFAQPLFRKWFLRFVVLTAALFTGGMVLNLGGAGQALTRITSNFALQQNYRQQNWQACIDMFTDSWGLGIGAGGYTTVLPTYNWKLAQSLYDYPHGIAWEVLAHYGVVGILLLGWLIWRVGRMSAQTIALSRGTEAAVFAWTMPAAMFGYFAWSFMEFTVAEKPFWEWLALYTALHFVVRRAHEEGTPIKRWKAELPVLFRRKR